MHRSSLNEQILITGGAGFVGMNLARNYLDAGREVHIFDNLIRNGVAGNLQDLQRSYPRDQLQFTQADVCDAAAVENAVSMSSTVFHLAAQVAVTTSLSDPMSDLRTNLLGTMNVLEAVRHSRYRPAVLFTSTNKVYGNLGGISLRRVKNRWEPEEQRLSRYGVIETQPLEFLSPYGCSKGSADQYVLDYANSYGIPATVFRMSCIYGPYQLGSEDQGWVAHFMRQILKQEPITIYGDGQQVRDVLFVDDLVSAMKSAAARMDTAAGQAFNLGGGWENSISLLELIKHIENLTGFRAEISRGAERLADQKWYIANTTKIRDALGFTPMVNIQAGLQRLRNWYLERPWLILQSEVQVA